MVHVESETETAAAFTGTCSGPERGFLPGLVFRELPRRGTDPGALQRTVVAAVPVSAESRPEETVSNCSTHP